jgi:anamorsin
MDSVSFSSAVIEEGSLSELKLAFCPTDDDLEKAFKSLQNGAKFLINNGIKDRVHGQALSEDVKLAGFDDVMVAKEADGGRILICQKPKWDVGAAASILNKEDIQASTSSSSWKVSIDDLAESDLVDEDDLLKDDLEGVTIAGDTMDCGVGKDGKKRACANCSCGLAEQLAGGDGNSPSTPATLEDQLAKSSGCGGCARGDAFRCAGCPFLGKPAFEPGQEKVILAMGDDDI